MYPEPPLTYKYLFQTSGYPIIDEIRAELESQSDWDFAQTTAFAQDFQHRAATKFGFSAPYSDEEQALGTYLVDKKAGLHISTYAWGLYASAVNSQKRYA